MIGFNTMSRNTYTFDILRFKPGQVDPPSRQMFEIVLDPQMSVLDGLETIRLTQDDTLMYRHCCHHASCGTCACTINGTAALACTTRLADLETATVELAPLANLTCLGDLVVGMRGFFENFEERWSGIKPVKTNTPNRTPYGVKQLSQLENCIECGCCVSACPVMPEADGFMGPAALAALNNQLAKDPRRRSNLLKRAAAPRGANRCRRHLSCSRVCPSKVYPARHIADLLRAIGTTFNFG
jgi:succinate dehydrogenase / fumarate reductase iron-sulfur subunit